MVYEKAEDAKKAISEYNGATLDNRLLTVQFDEQAPRIRAPGGKKLGKTLRVGGGRR